MKKIIICFLLMVLSSNICFANVEKDIKKAYKQINKICKKEDVNALKSYIEANKYAKDAILINSKELISNCIKKDYNIEILKLLVDNGANLGVRLKSNRTPLMYAARYNGNPEVIRFLLNQKYDVNEANYQGNIPLLTLCSNHPNSSAIYDLIDAGSDLFKINNYDRTAYMVLPPSKKAEILEYYNNSVSKRLTSEYIDKNKNAVVNKYGIPVQKMTVSKDVEIWEYDSVKEHYVELRAISNGSGYHHTRPYYYSRGYYGSYHSGSTVTTYTGGYTMKIQEKITFTFNKNCVSSVKYVASFSTRK